MKIPTQAWQYSPSEHASSFLPCQCFQLHRKHNPTGGGSPSPERNGKLKLKEKLHDVHLLHVLFWCDFFCLTAQQGEESVEVITILSLNMLPTEKLKNLPERNY